MGSSSADGSIPGGSCSSTCLPGHVRWKFEEDAPPRVLHLGLTATVVTGVAWRLPASEEDGSSGSCVQVAIKTVHKEQLTELAELEAARMEVSVHRQLRHPCLLPLLMAEETPTTFMLMTPLAIAGDLHEATKFITIREGDCRNLADQLLHALDYIHGAGFIHGDMKPQNILLQRHGGEKHAIQLTDFGLAASVKSAEPQGRIPFTGLRGTPGYFSPEEIRQEDYGSPSDVWVVGLMLYKLLAGYEPFYPATDFSSGPDFDDEYWGEITATGCNIVQALLSLDQDERPSAAGALRHEWFQLPLSDAPALASTEERSGLFPSTKPQAFRFFAFDELAGR